MDKFFSPEIILLTITQQCRSQLIEDVFNENPYLYDVLYSDINSEIFNIYKELYDLKWIKSHWDLIHEYIKNNKLNAFQKGQIISLFANWYREFLEGYVDEDSVFSNNIELINEITNLKIGNLESIIEFDKRCSDNMGKIETYFRKQQKILRDKIKKLKGEGD